jgi:hypothetical protein
MFTCALHHDDTTCISRWHGDKNDLRERGKEVLRERWGSILKPHFKTPRNACVSVHRDLERKDRSKKKKTGRERKGKKGTEREEED